MIDNYDEIEPFYTEGFLTTILGNKGSGKTDYSLTLGEIAIIIGKKHLATNIFCQPFKHLSVIDDDVKFLRLFLKLKENILLTLDEGGIFANSKEAHQENPRQLEKFILMVRHLRTAVIYISHRPGVTLPTIRDLSNAYVWKTGKRNFIWEYEGRRIAVNNVRKTNIPYQTHSFASFTFKLDWSKIFRDVSSISYDKAMLKLQEILNNKENYYNRAWVKELRSMKT